MAYEFRPLENKIYKEHGNAKHGMSRTPFYRCWICMRQRCTDPNVPAYKNYGGRGISVCDEWNDFEKFKEDMYESYNIHFNKHGRKNTTLDRVNVNGNYCIDNCVWATKAEQSINKRNNRFIEFNGETKTMTEWAKEFNVTSQSIYRRSEHGTPIDKKHYKNIVEINGKQMSLMEVSKKYSLSYGSLYYRYLKGIRDESILNQLQKKTS